MSGDAIDVHIDDLGEPRLPAAVRAQLEAALPLADQLRLDVDALCTHAARETGLDHFGDPGFRERLRILLRAVEIDVALTPAGRVGVYMQLLGFLKNRLRIEDLYRRHPEIEQVEVARPIVIAGLPRSGTTHLHNLLSADPALRALPYWEALEPVPANDEGPAPGASDPRIARCAEALAARDFALPYFDRMHEMKPDYVHEEIDLLAIDLSTMFFENLGSGIMPTWRRWYLATDQTPHYAYLKRVLRALQWLRGGERWVLKSPQHLEQFGPLLRVFPDATLVITHRDPVSIVASFSTMISYAARMAVEHPDLRRIGYYWASRVEDLLRAVVEQRDRLPTQRVMDVLFQDYMGHELEVVERVYALAGQPLPPHSREALEAYQKEHGRGRHGRVIYDLADFGLDAEILRERFRFYTDRFAVRLEDPPASR